MSAQPLPLSQPTLNLVNTAVLATIHLLAAFAIVYMCAIEFSLWSLGLGVVWYICCGLSITGGYHRLFAHPTYKAHWLVRLFYLLFGAASVQNSALKWAADHRRHHASCDREGDPYNINRGFWWAHIGWVLYQTSQPTVIKGVPDLQKDPLVMFQHRFYVPLAFLVGAGIPACLGLLWGDPWGALLIAGFLRLVVQWHSTFSVNSVAHCIGRRTFCAASSARDSFVTALVTFGEGYHSFHHKFMTDYRNGVRWYHFDPTKWWVWSLSKVGLAKNLRRVARDVIERARLEAQNRTPVPVPVHDTPR